jgi:hypothetical protein
VNLCLYCNNFLVRVWFWVKRDLGLGLGIVGVGLGFVPAIVCLVFCPSCFRYFLSVFCACVVWAKAKGGNNLNQVFPVITMIEMVQVPVRPSTPSSIGPGKYKIPESIGKQTSSTKKSYTGFKFGTDIRDERPLR